MKKYISIFLTFVLVVLQSANVFAVDSTYDYFVEAESFTSSNFRVDGNANVISDANSSGGNYIGVYTTSSAEYYAEYSVEVSEGGVYDLFLASSPAEGSSWSSKIYMSVNDGEKTELFGKTVSSTNNSRIKWYNVGSVRLNGGYNTIKYFVSDSISSGYRSAFIDCFGLNKSSFRLSHLGCEATMNVFQSGENISLSVNTNVVASEDSSYAYSLSDVYGNVVRTGTAIVAKGKSKAEIVFDNLGLGYYVLEVENLKTAFSIVKALSDRIKYSDTPFAIDTAFSYSAQWDVNRTDYAKILGLSGVSWIRDRITFDGNSNYSDGEYSFTDTKIQNTAQLLKPYGIRVSNVAGDVPENIVKDYGTYIPDDLLEVYKFWKSAANNYGDSVDNWEIFNEVDNGGQVGSWDSPDLYAAVMKAAAVGINDGSNAMVSVQGAMTGTEHKNEYGEMLIRNGVFDYSAFDNTHHHKFTSGTLASYYEFAGLKSIENRVNAQKNLNSKAPIWVTEAGIALEAAEGVDLNKEQQLVQAKYLVTSAVESIASGSDKHFFFFGPRYHEGSVSWGMMSEESYRPYMYPSYSAQCAMTDILGRGIYIGKIDKSNSNISAYLFNNGKNDVIVMWSKSGNQTISLNASGKVYDMWGNELSEIVKGNTITLDAEPMYVVCNNNEEGVVYNRRPQIVAEKKEINDAKRIVLLQKYSDVSRGGSRTDGYMISSTNNTVTLEVTNLSDKTMTGRINYNTENGWKLDKEYVDVTVEPMSATTIEFEIMPANGASTEYLSFVGEFDGQYTSPSTAKLVEVKDGIVTIEAETDAKSQNGFSTYTQGSNKGLKIYTQANGEYKIEFEVYSNESRVYDLWSLGGILGYTGCSNHTINVNGKKIEASVKNTKNVTYSSGENSVGWNSYNDVRLKKGLNVIEFKVSVPRNSGDGYIASALDKIVLVPKGLLGYREAENYTTKTGMYYTDDKSVASDGRTMKLFTYGIQNPISNNTLSYDFAVNEDGKYDVWILSTQANESWVTKWKFGFDGSTPSYPSSWTQTVENIVEIDGQEMYWYRVQNDAALTRGIHTVSIEGSEKRTNNDDYMFHIIDAVVVIKESSSSSWTNGWAPENSTNNMPNNMISVIKKSLLTEYDLKNITDNITLPKNVEGATISWSSSNSSVISGNGVVNRPEKGQGDVSVTLTASIDVDGTTSSTTYALTVKELTDAEREPELSAELIKYNDGYSGIQMYVKNTDILSGEEENMPAVVVAKYKKTSNEFLGFVGEQNCTYTNASGDKFIVDGNRVSCYITGAELNKPVTFVVYKEGMRPGKETIAYVNEYCPTIGDGDIEFSFRTKKGESAYRVVIYKNGMSFSKIIHIFEGQTIIYDENDTQDDKFVKQGIGRRVISTKGEAEMPLWRFPTPENEEDIIYKVFLWEWDSLKPLVEMITLNN